MNRIAIIGGHGKIALRLAELLTGAGHEVTSLFRNPAHADDVAATGATPLVADVENMSVADIAGALSGHDAVVWSAGAGGGAPARTYAVDRDAAIRSMDATAQAGIQRYVMVSYKGARLDHGVPEDDGFFAYAESKAAADAHLKETTLQWTILGPGRLVDDAPTGRIEVGPETTSPQVSRADVAQVAAAVLERPDTARRFIEFNNGPTPIAEALG